MKVYVYNDKVEYGVTTITAIYFTDECYVIISALVDLQFLFSSSHGNILLISDSLSCLFYRFSSEKSDSNLFESLAIWALLIMSVPTILLFPRNIIFITLPLKFLHQIFSSHTKYTK